MVLGDLLMLVVLGDLLMLVVLEIVNVGGIG